MRTTMERVGEGMPAARTYVFLPNLRHRLYRALRRFADGRRDAQRVRSGKRAIPAHLLTGERGEDVAYFYLRQSGYTVVARRWSSPQLRGDLDLLAWDGATLIAFEVKARTSRTITAAEFAVDPDKQEQLRRMVRAYLRSTPRELRESVTVRFDVVSIYAPEADQPDVEHLADAFPRVAPSPRGRV